MLSQIGEHMQKHMRSNYAWQFEYSNCNSNCAPANLVEVDKMQILEREPKQRETDTKNNFLN